MSIQTETIDFTKYPMILGCVDHEIIFDVFTDKGLDYIENILAERDRLLFEYSLNPIPSYEKQYGSEAQLAYYEDNSDNANSFTVDWYIGCYETSEFIEMMIDSYSEKGFIKVQKRNNLR